MGERNKNILDSIGSLIPGYEGYVKRSNLREDDKKIRNKIFEIIESKILTIKDNMLINIDKNEFVLKSETVIKLLENSKTKILYLPYGTSGFFSDKKITSDDLKLIYEMDLNLLVLSNKLEKINDLDEIKNLNNSILVKLNDRNLFLKEFH